MHELEEKLHKIKDDCKEWECKFHEMEEKHNHLKESDETYAHEVKKWKEKC